MPHIQTSPADEVIATAMDRIGNRLLQAAINAAPFSALRTCAAMGAVRVHFGHGAFVQEVDVAQARELIREINDILEVAPVTSRDALRRTRLELEALIDRREQQTENLAAIDAGQRNRERVSARKAALDVKAEG